MLFGIYGIPCFYVYSHYRNYYGLMYIYYYYYYYYYYYNYITIIIITTTTPVV